MYAIVETGGKQYRVEPGHKVRVENLGLEPGSVVSLDRVLVVEKEGNVSVGTPFVKGAAVKATVLENGKEDKVYIFHYRRKKNYRRFRGHRQPYTQIRIESIEA